MSAGNAGATNELHDRRFIAAPTVAGTRDARRSQWRGKPDSLHIDGWAETDPVDGQDIEPRREPFAGSDGSSAAISAVMFAATFSIATAPCSSSPTRLRAKSQALQSVNPWQQPNRDEQFDADQGFALDAVASEERLHRTIKGAVSGALYPALREGRFTSSACRQRPIPRARSRHCRPWHWPFPRPFLRRHRLSPP